MRTYVYVQSNLVTDVFSYADDFEITPPSEVVLIETTNMPIKPTVGWKLDGSKLVPPYDLAEYQLNYTIATRKEYSEKLLDRFKSRNLSDGINALQALWLHHRVRALSINVAGLPMIIDLLNMAISGDVEMACITLQYTTPDDMSMPYHWLNQERLNFLINDMKSFLGWA